MKKQVIYLFISLISFQGIAQQTSKPSTYTVEDPEETGWFKKDKMFAGGDLTLAFSSFITSLGVSPFCGYSINKYVDVAVSLNFNYTSMRDYYIPGDKARFTVIGPGTFVRFFPVDFIFGQLQFEHNFIHTKYIPRDISQNNPTSEDWHDANSLLLGAGYAGGRGKGSNSFYYFSVSWDLLKNDYSPYVDGFNRAIPIIRAGYNIALFQNSRR